MDWFIWRPVVAQMVSLKELQTWYDIKDLADFNEALDVKHALDDEAYERAKQNS